MPIELARGKPLRIHVPFDILLEYVGPEDKRDFYETEIQNRLAKQVPRDKIREIVKEIYNEILINNDTDSSS